MSISKVVIGRGGMRAGYSGSAYTNYRSNLYPKTVGQEVKKLKKKVRKINRAVTAEIRQRQVISGTSPLTQTGVIQMFNGMQYGDADSTRDANSINMLNINLAYDFTIVPANIPTSNGALTARVMLVYDKQANSALYSTQDLLQTSGSASINYLAPKNPDYSKRFQILYDRRHKLYTGENARGSATVTDRIDYAPQTFRIRRKLNKKTMFNDSNFGDERDVYIRSSLFCSILFYNFYMV